MTSSARSATARCTRGERGLSSRSPKSTGAPNTMFTVCPVPVKLLVTWRPRFSCRSPLMNTGITGTLASWMIRPTPRCAGRSVYGSSSFLRVPSGWSPAKVPPRRSIHASSSRLSTLSVQLLPLAEDRRVHREEAHRPVHDEAERAVVEEVRAHRERDAVRQHAGVHEVARDHVQVEEAAVVGDADEALPRVELRQALEPVHLPQVLRADVNPVRADVLLQKADGTGRACRARSSGG